MNPEIRKFWEQIGDIDCTLSAPIQYYVVETKNYCIMIAAIWNGGPQDGPEQPAKYFYNKVKYTEEEMLKIIKLAAFL